MEELKDIKFDVFTYEINGEKIDFTIVYIKSDKGSEVLTYEIPVVEGVEDKELRQLVDTIREEIERKVRTFKNEIKKEAKNDK